MIVTCKKNVPKRWVIFAILPWASFTFNGGVIGTAFLFSLQKFIENPAGLTFILSLPGILAIVVSPIASFLSDRVWTRVGRRKPFVIASWTGMLISMVLMPVMPNFWLLLGTYLFWQFSSAVGAPIEALKQEIIPPKDRGWATGAMTWCSNLATMTFYFVMLGRFDDVSYLAGLPIRGEWLIYWSAALLFGVLLFLIILGIRETDPKSALRGERLTVRNFLGGLLDRELWPVYLLVFGNACLNFYSGLGALSNLLYTVQWGYTKQEMGVNVAVGGVVNLFIIGLLTVLANRLNRMRAYQTALILCFSANIAYYCYVEFVLPDKRPTLVEIIVFGETVSIFSILVGLLYIPLVYDYVRRNLMGTFGAGSAIVSRLTTLITLNGVGLFVTGYAYLFQPPAGDMTRVVLREPISRAQLIASLSTAAPGLAVNSWAANGVIEKQGRTWEIRRRDPASEALAQEKDNLEAERSPLLTQAALAKLSADSLRDRGRENEAQAKDNAAKSCQARIAAISKRIADIDSQLSSRADDFKKQVAQNLGSSFIAEGDQILGASERPALEVALPAALRPEPAMLDKILDDLRREDSSVIDLRPGKQGTGYDLEASALLPVNAGRLEAEVRAAAARHLPHLLDSSAPAAGSARSALTLDLLVVEEPVDRYVSPVTRGVNRVLAFFGREPDPHHRLLGLARALRSPAEANHLRVKEGPEPRSISITALFEPGAASAASADDPVGGRLAALLGHGNNDLLRARAFYDQAQTAAATQRLTVAHPVLAADYAPMRYDYMSGYLWMFVMGGIGIALTFYFQHLESRGIVQKRGVEEALAS